LINMYKYKHLEYCSAWSGEKNEPHLKPS
jgi:hypothetical protein